MLNAFRIRRAAPRGAERRVMSESCRACHNRLIGLCPTWPQGSW